MQEAESELTGQQAEPAGLLRISVPTPLGHHRVLPLLPAFHARYPQVQVDVQISNRNIDFIADGFDLALRGRAPPDSGLVARHLMDAQLVVVAAPSYLALGGTPHTLEDLAAHDCIQFVLPSTGVPVPWMFLRNGQELEMATQGNTRVSEDLQGVATLARAGGGVVQTYRFMVEEDVRSGALVEVLQTFGGRSRPFHLLYPRNRHLPLRVRVFVDFLVQALEPERAL